MRVVGLCDYNPHGLALLLTYRYVYIVIASIMLYNSYYTNIIRVAPASHRCHRSMRARDSRQTFGMLNLFCWYFDVNSFRYSMQFFIQSMQL